MSRQQNRLAASGRIDRAEKIRFTFDGRQLTGLAGDTLASALLANGVKLVGRSFKYHRPRGILSAGAEEPNALVTLCIRRATRRPTCRPPCWGWPMAWSRKARTAGRLSP